MAVAEHAQSIRSYSSFRTLYQHHELLVEWILRTVRARYKQSLLGGLWAIVQPALRALVFTIIFTAFIPVDTGEIPYIIFSYTALVPWTFFASSLTDMVASLVFNMNLVTKIYFPREILPLAALLARLLDFFIAGGLLIVLMLLYDFPIFTRSWLYLPVILLIQLALTFGIGLLTAAINVFYRDMSHLIVFGVQIWMYATPIIYPVANVPEQLRFFYFLNPMAGVIEAYRATLLQQQAPDLYLLFAALEAMIFLCVGYYFFKRVEFQFADVI